MKKITVFLVIVLVSVLVGLLAHELEAGPFTPVMPKGMPIHTVWVNAPTIPFAFHHGGWFGCDSGQTEAGVNTCTEILHRDRWDGGDGNNVVEYTGPFISCKKSRKLEASELDLKSPIGTWKMTIKLSGPDPYSATYGVIGFLKDGDVLAPTSEKACCPEFLLKALTVR